MNEITTREFRIDFKSSDGAVLGSDFFEAEGYPEDVYREAERYAEEMMDADSFSAAYYSLVETTNEN